MHYIAVENNNHATALSGNPLINSRELRELVIPRDHAKLNSLHRGQEIIVKACRSNDGNNIEIKVTKLIS